MQIQIGPLHFSSFFVPLPFLLLPIEIRPDIRAPLAASLARKQGLDTGQPDVIRQQTAHARGAHFPEGDFLRAGEFGHAPLKRA
jgi:hypothetical protein